MANERKSPDALLVQTNLEGIITAIVDDPNDADVLWLTATNVADDSICHVSFQTPTGNPTAGPGFQEFKILARLTANATPCVYSVDLYEGGVFVSNIDTGTVTSTIGQLITSTWDASILGTADGSDVEVKITIESAMDTTGEIGAVEWNITYTPAGPSDSIREKILQSLESQLKEITTANGYDFNITGTSVLRARRHFFDDQLPAIGIFDGAETVAMGYGSTKAEMQVTIEMHADVGAENRSVILNRMKATLEKAVMSHDITHAGKATGTSIRTIEMRLPDDDDSSLVSVAVTIGVSYRTVTGNPYSQP